MLCLLHEDAHRHRRQWTPSRTARAPGARGVQHLGQSPKGLRAAPGEHRASCLLRPRPPRLASGGDYLTPPLELGERIFESQEQTWNSISDPLLTASRDCRRKRRSIKIAPKLPQILQLNRVASWIWKGVPKLIQILTFIERFPCAKALC